MLSRSWLLLIIVTIFVPSAVVHCKLIVVTIRERRVNFIYRSLFFRLFVIQVGNSCYCFTNKMKWNGAKMLNMVVVKMVIFEKNSFFFFTFSTLRVPWNSFFSSSTSLDDSWSERGWLATILLCLLMAYTVRISTITARSTTSWTHRLWISQSESRWLCSSVACSDR